jgi:NDP-sugar pyrophosphorylase family protein
MLPVIILAGGMATRLRPITEKIPKALVEVAGEPFLAHQLRLLRDNGIRKVVMSVAYKGEMIQEFAGTGDRFGLSIEYRFDGPQYLGTGGAISNAMELLDESFFVLYGDSYLTCDFQAVATHFVASGKQALMTVFRNEGLWDSSNVEFSGGHIRVYDKKERTAAMQHIDYGLGVFQRSAFDSIAAGEAADLAGLYQRLLAEGQLEGYEVNERFYEIGTPEGLRETEQFILGKRKGLGVNG